MSHVKTYPSFSLIHKRNYPIVYPEKARSYHISHHKDMTPLDRKTSEEEMFDEENEVRDRVKIPS